MAFLRIELFITRDKSAVLIHSLRTSSFRSDFSIRVAKNSGFWNTKSTCSHMLQGVPLDSERRRMQHSSAVFLASLQEKQVESSCCLWNWSLLRFHLISDKTSDQRQSSLGCGCATASLCYRFSKTQDLFFVCLRASGRSLGIKDEQVLDILS